MDLLKLAATLILIGAAKPIFVEDQRGACAEWREIRLLGAEDSRRRGARACCARARIVAALRALFRARDFVEIEPSALQISPGNETHIAAFATRFPRSAARRQPLYLHSSPEFDCKKLLAAGETRIFSLAHVFRNGERTKLHHPEFTMLEWYRAGAHYRALIEDCAAILRIAARGGRRERVPLRRRRSSIPSPRRKCCP